jgi:hypothetical protein
MPRKAVVGQVQYDVESEVGHIESEVADADSASPVGDIKTGSEDVGGVRAFPPEYKEPLMGLLYLGKLTDTFKYAGHVFSLKTLTEGQLLKAAQLTSQYEKTLGYQIAYRCAIVAMSLVSVDGREIYSPVSMTEDEEANRFEVVLDWYPVVIDYVYRKFIELDAVATSIGDELGKA